MGVRTRGRAPVARPGSQVPLSRSLCPGEKHGGAGPKRWQPEVHMTRPLQGVWGRGDGWAGDWGMTQRSGGQSTVAWGLGCRWWEE